MKHHSSGRGVLLAVIALLVIVTGARFCSAHASAGTVEQVVVTVPATPSAASENYPLFLPAISGRWPDPLISTCTSEHPELCTAQSQPTQ